MSENKTQIGLNVWRNSNPSISTKGEWSVNGYAFLKSGINEITHNYGLPGLICGYFNAEVGYKSISAGYADVGHKNRIHDGLRFRLCSLSKIITSHMIFKLSKDGLLDLDAPVGNILPNLDDDYTILKSITVRSILKMMDGFPAYDIPNRIGEDIEDIQIKQAPSLEDILNYLDNDSMREYKGFWYGPNSYLFLGKIIEVIVKADYEGACKEYLHLTESFSIGNIGTSSKNEVTYYAAENFDDELAKKMMVCGRNAAYSSALISLREGTGGWIATPHEAIEYFVKLLHSTDGYREFMDENAVQLREGRRYSCGFFQYTDEIIVREGFLPGVCSSIAISSSNPTAAFCFSNASPADKINALRYMNLLVTGMLSSEMAGEGVNMV